MHEPHSSGVRRITHFVRVEVVMATISNMRIDDIFTNVLIQHGRKALNKENMGLRRSDQLHSFGNLSGTRLEHCEEIFIDATNDESSPKRILLTGKAGIGKTLFCQKFVRDWADDELLCGLQSSFTFVYLLTFRQLNLFENDQLSLQELFNCSTVLDNSSNINDALFEYIVNHPEEVLIIIDGYDEYSQQDYITGESEKRYQNTVKEKMPVAALCTKLIKGKLLRDSVVMITSRPEESDEKMEGIRFDRCVEIAGFSPQQVQEFIEKYFRENDTMKNAVLDHVMKNENLVSFAHIPILCFLMCFSMEYALQTSKSTDLPVSTTDIYSEVVNIFELKHNAASEFKTKEIPGKFKGSLLVENTLDILSEFAAKLLLKKKPIFEERDMEETFRSEEIEKLKGSGLLHCGPPFRKSLLATTKYFSFTHMTIHEFLAARWFVMRNVIPNDVSGMVLQFIAGILSKKKNDELMENLLKSIPFSSRSDYLLLRAKCLSEYQDKEFAKNVIKNHSHHYSPYGELCFNNLNDVDCIAISFLLDAFSALNDEEATNAQHQRSEQPSTVISLIITYSYLTPSGLNRIVESLDRKSCSVTILEFFGVQLIKCFDCISGLVCSKLKGLHVYGMDSSITDDDVTSLCDALTHPCCKVTTLGLGGNHITDTGVTSLCDALKHPSCKVTTLDLSGNQITDTGVTSLCDALTHPSCNVTTLDLSRNQITDTGVTSLCVTVQHDNCKLVALDLSLHFLISEESKQFFTKLAEQHRPGFKLRT